MNQDEPRISRMAWIGIGAVTIVIGSAVFVQYEESRVFALIIAVTAGLLASVAGYSLCVMGYDAVRKLRSGRQRPDH